MSHTFARAGIHYLSFKRLPWSVVLAEETPTFGGGR